MVRTRRTPDLPASLDNDSLPVMAGVETTATLLLQIRDGDSTAKDRLVSRFLPRLQRWARGRVPGRARNLADTDDLVQETLFRALERVDEFVPRREGAFFAYLRGILLNRIRDLLRKSERRVPTVALPTDLPAGEPSPLEEAIGREALEAYEAGLRCLTGEQQMAVILRVELAFTHQEIAQALDLPTPNAARMLIARGLVRLSEAMGQARARPE